LTAAVNEFLLKDRTMAKKIILSIFTVLLFVNPLFSEEIEKLWGISRPDLISRLGLVNYSEFKPEDKPEYTNKIIDFFSSMNPEERAAITILRVQGKPDVDYCFFNEKLYSVSEDWGNVDRTKAGEILKTLKGNYSELSTDDKNPVITYSFKKRKTKGLLTKKIIDERSVQVRIFYYSTDLFSMLLRE
jgi:hypothetical protein